MNPKPTQDFGGGVYLLQDMEWVVIAVGVTTICLVTSLCWWLLHDENKKKEMRRGKIPKGSLGWPIIGETLHFISSGYSSKPPPLTFLEKRKSLYGNVFKTNILGSNVIVSTEVEVNKVILLNQGNIFVSAYPKSIREIFGDYSILHMTGTLHRNMHALIISFLRSPHFKARITSDIERSVKHCLLTWKHATPHQPIYVQDQVKMITFPVLVKVLMSVSGGEELKLLKKDFQEFVKGLICVPIKFPGTRLYKSLKAKERMVKIVKRIMEERMKNTSSTSRSDEENDVVDVMLRNDWNPKPTLEMMSSNIIELTIPGEETVPTAMTIAIFFLSNSPLALSKLIEENMELKRHKTSTDNKYAWTDYMSLPFTQNVISETLRMANIVNGIWRKAQKDVEIKGYLIPKGWCVMACLTSVHLDSNNYENPFKFDPWRWEKIGAAASNNCYAPFGGGQRLCPGWELSRLELAIFLHHLVTTYRWVADRDEIQYFPTVKMRRKLPIISVEPINA
ncbi:cytochrome P450 [Stylosanthes scabra]|uniref:Cytochrome P450 n=1 Tax=Stylosanthes scabra TaxID=79078 RepID=A0ABU6RHA2_9FABA|nr:cytochrome P450 [Stylosanthes scabra]